MEKWDKLVEEKGIELVHSEVKLKYFVKKHKCNIDKCGSKSVIDCINNACEYRRLIDEQKKYFDIAWYKKTIIENIKRTMNQAQYAYDIQRLLEVIPGYDMTDINEWKKEIKNSSNKLIEKLKKEVKQANIEVDNLSKQIKDISSKYCLPE